MTRIVLASCLFAAIASCAVEHADDIDIDDVETTTDTWQPIASLELDTGLSIDFYEPKAGAVMVMQSGPAGVPTVPGRRRPVDLYRALAPEQPVPAALLAAQARADSPDGVAPDVDPAAEKRAIDAIMTDYAAASAEMSVGYIDNRSCDDHYFDDHYCADVDADDWSMCKLNHWDGAYAYSSSVDTAYYIACADIGNITLKVVMGNGDGGNWDITEGDVKTYYWWTGWLNESTRGDIINATNNRFHFAVGYNF